MTSKKLQVTIKNPAKTSYEILVGEGVLRTLAQNLQTYKWRQKYAVIIDKKVEEFHGKHIREILKGIACDFFPIKNGEQSKTVKTVLDLAKKMLEKKFTRDDAVIAIGGGVTTDLAGFLASIYMRGIPVIQVPTTLLAMVDASIGGKTGVNLKEGKNLIGTFYQPKKVYIDTNFLSTLPLKELRNGLAEVVKCAVIRDKKLFEFIEKNYKKILSRSQKYLNKIIIQACKIKKEIVEKDEKESFKRILLNYGHTYGHAIEKESNYKIPHGYAVSIGMTIANEIAEKSQKLHSKNSLRIKNLLKKLGLPHELDKKYSLERLHRTIQNDKKVRAGKLHMVLPKTIGKASVIPLS